jgi:hypothetical protein
VLSATCRGAQAEIKSPDRITDGQSARPVAGPGSKHVALSIDGVRTECRQKKPPRQRVDLRFPWRLLYLVTEPERPLLALSALAVFLNRPQVDR